MFGAIRFFFCARITTDHHEPPCRATAPSAKGCWEPLLGAIRTPVARAGGVDQSVLYAPPHPYQDQDCDFHKHVHTRLNLILGWFRLILPRLEKIKIKIRRRLSNGLGEILEKEGKRLKTRPQVTDFFLLFFRRRVKRNQKRAGEDNMPPRILLFSLAA